MDDKKKVTIVTHSSGFHTDDVFAVATLLLLLKDQNVSVVRSRDMTVVEEADYVVDFGSVYDPKRRRFDHHQTGGAGKRENGVPYASFGLVWKEYGERVCNNAVVAEKIDKVLVQPVDMIYSGKEGMNVLHTQVPELPPFDVTQITKFFTPTWKEDVFKIDEVFMDLVSYARVLLSRLIVYMQDSLDGEQLVMDAYGKAEDKRIINLDNSKYPWEQVLSKFPEPIYVVYKNKTDNTWSIKCVRDDLWTYVSRKDLPGSWAGKKDEELEKVTGVSGSVFCHNARFMAVAKTKEGALQMAKIALNS